MRKRTSVIWQVSDEEFRQIVATSVNVADCLSKFGLVSKGNNFVSFKARAKFLDIDLTHFTNKVTRRNTSKLQDLLVKESKYSRHCLKKRIIQERIIPYICSECSLKDIWNNKKLVLQLDHKNGISDDNRIENLRFLCPNCHSQTDSFAGKSKSKRKT